ncbi:acyltransferase [Fistulina hepatica ATCC 64428]|uniref:Acyltransferase n=1 Tax=Fistulina hepatica ATCC 64428 TaxID=1128425 RepID=A0A0D7AMG1_9AGAR|nr:acyltransferase [Fistulina hepatica ATCC 64428]
MATDSSKMDTYSEPNYLHRFLRYIAELAIFSFFTEIRVIGSENVPKDSPIIAAGTHHNMMLDPAILSVTFPYSRLLHFWAKASLFQNPVVRYILMSSGNIPVDRRSKDQQSLFHGSFTALAHGAAIALFPEGTSYTEPRIMQVKDGAAWAALEYTKWNVLFNGGRAQDVHIIPSAIVYTNKSKYRSRVVVEYGQPISMEPYKRQFLNADESSAKKVVKRLTRDIESRLVELTVNAPNWDTLYVARMARNILWDTEGSLNLDDYVATTQTLVDMFTTDATSIPDFNRVKRQLLDYYSLLQSTHLTNSVLSKLSLPITLDPDVPATLPSRLYTLLLLIRDSLSMLLRLPFFVYPLVVHFPAYVLGRLGARLVEEEEETQAQNKVVFGLLALLTIYAASFFFLWAVFWYTPIGAMGAFLIVYLVAKYHNQMINDNYEHAKRLIADWRILVGIWAPKKWEFPVHALSQYTTPFIPKENPWISKKSSSSSECEAAGQSAAPVLPPEPAFVQEPPVRGSKKHRRPPSRRIMRHVLRSRVEAVRAVASLFDHLQRNGNLSLYASGHLARAHGSAVSSSSASGSRSASEVIEYLTARGAKIPRLDVLADEEHWAAALSSEGEEGTSGNNTTPDDSMSEDWRLPTSG